MIKVLVEGKTRIIRDKMITHQSENSLECYYKNHQIIIEKQRIDDFYVSVTDERGMHAVHGGFGGDYCTENIKTIEDCLVMCIKNILL
jgi:hypothetical protein